MEQKTDILFLGDFCVNDPTIMEISPELQELLSSSSLRVINFEAPLKEKRKIVKSGPALFQSEDAPAWLEQKGINVVSLANNHMMDYGIEGALHTVEKFRNSVVLGVGYKNEAYECKTIEINGIKIGFLSLTHYEFGILEDEEEYGTAWINHPMVNDTISEAKLKNDYLIILVHAGVEEIDIPLPEWRYRYQEFIDLGADVIVGSHPHTPQGWEMYKQKPIFYSIGNCMFEMETTYPYWNKGLAIKLSLVKRGITFDVFPIQFDNNLLSLDTSEKAETHINYLNKLLSNESEYIKKVNTEVLKLWNEVYYFYFVQGLGAYVQPKSIRSFLSILYRIFFFKKRSMDYATLLNNIRCESHRWCIQRALQLILYKRS